MPSPLAWKQWHTFISWQYLQPNSMWLQQPLGPWLPTYTTDFTWRWQACPKSFYLFHYLDGTWWSFSLTQYYTTHVGYKRHPSPTSPPTGTVPMTPILFPYKIHLPLPLSLIQKPPQPILAHPPLATCLVTPPVAWAQPLWNDIRPHAHNDTLRQALLTNNQVLLVSDAAVHPNGTGTCAWTIWATSKLWSGEGYIPGTIEDMYSGLAKAYGLYTVISFLNHYSDSVPTGPFSTPYHPRLL